MRTILVTTLAAIVLGLFLGLPGCTTLGTTGVDTQQSVTVQQVQRTINEANATLAAIASVIAQNVTDGTMAKPDAQSALTKVKEYASYADQAQKLLDDGVVLDAKSRAEFAHGLISSLHKQVAAKARTP